jgi:hypothetical protein
LIKPSPEVVKALGATVSQHPVLLEWIQGWRDHELKQLPSVANNVAIAQGRCQVLGELSKLATEAPELAAKSR